jgi:hypothetical protein
VTRHHLGARHQTGRPNATTDVLTRYTLTAQRPCFGLWGRPILAYLDDIYILSRDELELEQTLAFFDERHPSIRLNPAKCKSLALEDIHTDSPRMLGTCGGARSARHLFLQENIDTCRGIYNLMLKRLRLCLWQVRIRSFEL